MPIYEYQCDACSHALEALQKISDAPLSECPQCKASALRKKVSAAGFRLKGGGWYETDFKSGGKKNVTTGGESAASESSTPASAASSESASSATAAAPAAGHGNGCACH
jgi:putative FmdB family regulatory protein